MYLHFCHLKMLLLCLCAILVSVQCAPQDFHKVKLKKQITHSQYGAVLDINSQFLRSTAGKVLVTYSFRKTISEDIRSIINNLLLPYIQEKTCLVFKNIPLNSVDTTDSEFTMVFSQTEEKLENCFGLNTGGRFLSVRLNEECVRQMAKELRAGKAVKTDYVDVINDSVCK